MSLQCVDLIVLLQASVGLIVLGGNLLSSKRATALVGFECITILHWMYH